MTRAILIGSLSWSLFAVHAAGQDREADKVYITGQVDTGRSTSGAGGGAEWSHPMSSQSGLIAGGYSMNISNYWWTYGRLGGFTRRSRFVLAATMDAGSATKAGDRSAYGRYLGTVTVPLSHGFYAEAEEQYIRAAHTGTRVFKVGALYGFRQVEVRAAHYSALTNGVPWHYVAGRGDVKIGRFGLLGGMTTGKSERLSELEAIELLTQTSREVFFGASITSGQVQTLWSLAVTEQASNRYARLLLMLRLPVGARSPAAPERSR